MPSDQIEKLLSETIFRDIMLSVADAVVTIDEGHRVVYCNRVAERMFGYSSEELIGRDVSPLIPEPHFSLHRGYVDRFIQTGEARVIGKSRECIGQSRDGVIFPAEISYSASQTAGKLYFTAVIRDISERKGMEREMRFMEKLADVGKAVAHVVHEIRKPLMLIGGFARQVESCGALEGRDKDRHKLQIVVDEVRRLETLLDGIRLLTRPPASSQKRSLFFNELLRETLDLFEPMLKDHDIALRAGPAENNPRVSADPDQLKQVLLNLLQNAVDAVSGSGEIGISAKPDGPVVRIEISDSGPGIPPDMLDKVFDPFFTTKPEGTGLGLAITKNIITDHGGEISVRSETGKGTSFTVTLPIVDT